MTTLIDGSTSKFKALTRLVGNTPLLTIQLRYHGRDRVLFAKSEYLSLTGSIKDRMALSILQKAYAEGTIEPGDTIAEATSGNTGIAFAAIGRMLGHPVKIFMPDWMSQERVQLIKSYGAEDCLGQQRGWRISWLHPAVRGFCLGRKECILASAILESRKYECPCGNHRAGNLVANAVGRKTAAGFCVRSWHGRYGYGRSKIPASSRPIYSYPPRRASRIADTVDGLQSGQPPNPGYLRRIHPGDSATQATRRSDLGIDGDAILMAQKLASSLGLAVGISSGCNFLAALQVLESFEEDAAVVTVFCDDSKKYLSTALTQVEPIRPGYLSSDVELTGVGTVGRVCEACQ